MVYLYLFFYKYLHSPIFESFITIKLWRKRTRSAFRVCEYTKSYLLKQTELLIATLRAARKNILNLEGGFKKLILLLLDGYK